MLCNSLYLPEAFEQRTAKLIDTFGRRREGRPTDNEQSTAAARTIDSIRPR